MKPKYEYDLLIYIGRFQPFHKGHSSVIEEALKKSSKVLVLIGEPSEKETPKNPFSYSMRLRIIQNTLNKVLNKRVYFSVLCDCPTDEEWASNVRLASATGFRANKIGIIGHKKDDSSNYLSFFPRWGYVEAGNFESINATDIRNDFFGREDGCSKLSTSNLHPTTVERLRKFAQTEQYQKIKEQFDE